MNCKRIKSPTLLLLPVLLNFFSCFGCDQIDSLLGVKEEKDPLKTLLWFLPLNKRYYEGTCGQTSVSTGSIVRFAAIGDHGSGTQTQFDVAAAIQTRCAGSCDFILTLGDNIYQKGVTSIADLQWMTKFVNPYSGLVGPFYPTLGNHDYNGDLNFYRGQVQVDYSTVNSKWIMPGQFYTFETSPALFFAIDTEGIQFFYDQDKMAHQNCFDPILAVATQPWKIVFGHRPYISNGIHGNAAREAPILNAFYRNYICSFADLIIGGHDHNLQILPGSMECPAITVVSGGGGADNLYDLPGTNPVAFQIKNNGFFYFEITSTSLFIEALDSSGNSLHTMTTTKP